MDRAEALLRHTDIPIAAIAEQCGFASPFHFSRLFKSSRDLSPRAFRSRYRALEQFPRD
ncbi:AraC family transcriptional regulator [Marinobacterium sedimentorum]|uniref:AraC family transcriptional regulator n=1 Tax=Marinobacterium sedimentorum TaxID=2927804 RepID=UPI0034CD406A